MNRRARNHEEYRSMGVARFQMAGFARVWPLAVVALLGLARRRRASACDHRWRVDMADDVRSGASGRFRQGRRSGATADTAPTGKAIAGTPGHCRRTQDAEPCQAKQRSAGVTKITGEFMKRF